SFIVRGLEPSVRVAPDGTVYVSSIRGVPTGVDLHRYYAAADGPAGLGGIYPFKYEGQPDNCGIFNMSQGGCANNSLDPLGVGLGGGDVDIAVNYPTTGTPNLALVSLTLAPGITGTHSADRGHTFSAPNPLVALIPGDDRQWIDGTDALTVYLNYHDAETFNIDVQRSNDGGQTYLDGFAEAIDAQTLPAVGGVPPTNSANIAGQIKVDRSSSCPSRGNLYQIFVAPDSAAENLAGGALRSIYVGVSTDVNMGLPVFTFTDHKVFTGPAGAQNQGAGNLFPVLAVDDFGFVYAAWSVNSDIFYSFSTDQGTTWSSPINVSFPVNGGHANLFPWIAADANGHVGIVWFGDDRAGNSNDRASLEPGHPASQGAACTSGSTCMQNWAKWNVYYAESVNGHDAPPFFVRSVISDHVIHRGTISTGGLGGGADRSLADLFQIAFDPQHFANVAFSDDHLINTEVSGSDNGFDNPTSRRKIRANFTHQLAATAGFVVGGNCAGQPPPPGGEKITGGGQVASQTPGQTANFGFIANSNKPNASLSYHDDGANGGAIDVHSANTSVPSMTFSGNCATFKGDAKVNQQLGYKYTVNACDNGEPGAGKDTFFISVTGPNFSYSNGGFITEGNIQIHKQ
ncbi:MAG TPA: post-COAP-1 domain-containing protein, partial [Bryobacteraceae bacterium]|nr:post-COAP-1 domain-containing protein [Bryobacteraceae bacterium]